MLQNLTKFTFLLALLFTSYSTSLLAQEYLPQKPKKQTSVYDMANMMTEREGKLLEQKLIRYSDTTSTQIVVITINSLEGNEVGIYATELAHKWGIGQAGKDNGILVLAAKDDKKVTIRTGYGIESILTDALSRAMSQY